MIARLTRVFPRPLAATEGRSRTTRGGRSGPSSPPCTGSYSSRRCRCSSKPRRGVRANGRNASTARAGTPTTAVRLLDRPLPVRSVMFAVTARASD
eukprot:31132-Pelagococcus_subviridis.AAC.5